MRAGAPLSRARGRRHEVPAGARNVRVKDREGLDGADGFWAEVRAVEAELGDDGRVLVRPSGTEPVVRVMVEAERRAEIADAAVARLTTALESALGQP